MKRILQWVKGLFPKPQKVEQTPYPEKKLTLQQMQPANLVKGSKKVIPRHNNRKWTPGRKIQYVPIIVKPSHYVKIKDINGNEKVMWIPDKMGTRPIFHNN